MWIFQAVSAEVDRDGIRGTAEEPHLLRSRADREYSLDVMVAAPDSSKIADPLIAAKSRTIFLSSTPLMKRAMAGTKSSSVPELLAAEPTIAF